MSTETQCAEFRLQLTDLVDGTIGQASRDALNHHLEQCEECNSTLEDLWELRAMATRWRDLDVPHLPKRGDLLTPPRWLPGLQMLSAAASVAVLVLVLGQVRISTGDGLDISFGKAYATRADVDARLDAFRADQRALLATGIDAISARQSSENQAALRTMLATSRDERRQDLTTLLSVVQDAQSKQAHQTRTSLQYLIATQIQDRRDIRQLGRAIGVVPNEGGTL